ncbi:hypothetical protein LB557_09450 [Mesorhizobium sp. BR115XR7A]|uniref:hypothetical protein n=1 Tax=Mesorhizobium sp. BR115XR7A TaxID=2876645 RepID=UPI001CCB2C42|nr:hypothetical protein [Mesorhizobium sp. BR115XR7A]MBZ9906221.1 hypothetical protein [Mesorhizobium sp. BR115XR7A]MBZ9933414.1 hypothetical protein [Mesorhizobium sp. BR1-1-5]
MRVDLDIFQKTIREFSSGMLPYPADRYAILADRDPYEDIPAALLHSGHIASYAITTGMIEPFDIEDLKKPASLLVALEGPVRYRDDDGKVKRFYLSKDPSKYSDGHEVKDEVTIKPNSLYYLTLKPEFRMPNYIAGRFNLMIRDVYRGFLVGTGPLVDPGFQGRLSIPLHNLTNSEYTIRADEGFVYFEFTKLSWKNPPSQDPLPAWIKKPVHVQPPFPSSKNKRKTLDNYLDEATSNGPAQSSIGPVLSDAKKHVELSKTLLDIYTIGGAIGVLVLLLTAWSLYAGVQSFTLAAQTSIQSDIRQAQDRILALEIELREAKGKIDQRDAPTAEPIPPTNSKQPTK